MFKNYFKTAFRNVVKYKGHTLINIAGLAVGICAVMLIYLYITFELSYDSFHKGSEKIFRVSVINEIKDKGTSEGAVFLDALAPVIKNEIPEVEQTVRVSDEKPGLLSNGQKQIQINSARYADSTFLDIFSFELLMGNHKQILNKPFTALLTEETSDKLFGNKNPIGQIVDFNDLQFEITGIIKNPPLNSHLKFNMLLSFGSLYQMKNVFMGWNGGNQYITYVKLVDKNRSEAVDKKLVPLMWKYLNKKLEPFGWKFTAYLQPLKEIHLKYDDQNQTRLINIFVFSIVAMFILLIACINYINLTIAGSLKRSKEVGVKKVFGASRIELIKQFIAESFLIIIISSVISIAGLYLIIPSYKKFIGDFFNTDILISINSIAVFAGGAVLISLIASLYPAFYLSRMTPLAAINENRLQRSSKFNIRNALILLQFVISIGMISSTLIISSQLSFVKHRDLGFRKENIFVLGLNSIESRAKYLTIKNEISKITGVQKVTATSAIPINGFTSNGYLVEGQNAPNIINVVDADKDFLDTYKIKLISGRNFSEDFGTDKDSYLVNEEFVKQYGLKNPLGKTINRNSPHKIIGVVADFSFASAYEKISPLIITSQPESGSFNYLSVVINSINIVEVISAISKTFENICPDTPFDYKFLDEALAQVYHDEANFRTLFVYFSSLSILISITGLLGLTIFSLTQKRKEIGIRKVLGASVINIIKLAYKEYLLIILTAFVIASLLSKYFMDVWLEKFAFRIEPSLGLFLLSGLIAIVISFITVTVYTVKAAMANPSDSLRYE